MIKNIIAGFAAGIVFLILFIAVKPAEFQISRSIAIAAPARLVYAQVYDFRKWEAWSPWAKLDPAMQTSFSGAPSGVGAVYAWKGNDQVGEGKMTLSQTRPDELIGIDLEFIKPFAAKNSTEFSFKPDGDKTQVTWAMSGKNNFFGRAFDLFMNMDKTVGGDFEKGLAQLKAVAEAAAIAPPPAGK